MTRTLFATGHATHPQWRLATALVVAQLRGQMGREDRAAAPALGIAYLTDDYAAHAEGILATLRAELPEVRDWSGASGVGIAAGAAEYIDEPALAVMLCDLPAGGYRVFSGVAPLAAPGASDFDAHAALVHADGALPDLPELIGELADRTTGGYLFGGIAGGRAGGVQLAAGAGQPAGPDASGGVFRGGLSGVAFGAGVRLVSRVTQGCRPVGPVHAITAAQDNVVTALDGEPALQTLLDELQVDLDEPRTALARVRATLAGLSSDGDAAPADGPAALVRRTGDFGADTRVRHIIGLDPSRQGVALADRVAPGMRLAFCERNAVAARADLVRICAEIREELEPEDLPLSAAAALAAPEAEAAPHPARRIAGAIYVSCAGRGGPHFGAPDAELQTVRRALGDVPLVGFFAGGEIARRHLYGYTGVLTVFALDVEA